MSLLDNAASGVYRLLRNLRIGVRLRLVFALTLALLLLGSAVSLWHWSQIRQGVERVSQVERRMTAMLQLDNSVLTLMNELHRAGDSQRKEYFRSQALRLLGEMQSNTQGAAEVLRGVKPDNDRQAVLLDSLISILDAMPARVRSLIDLAGADDWVALHARLSDEVDYTDDVVAAVVREIDRDLSEARRRLLREVSLAQERSAWILGITGVLSVLSAGLIGLLVTRSITRPLADLGAGARALAHGQFDHQAVIGNDELARLASVFNATAHELQALYAQVRHSEAYFRSLIENASDLIVIVSRDGNIAYVSPSSARILGYPSEALLGRPIADYVSESGGPSLIDQVLAAGPRTGPQPISVELRHADGSQRILEGVATNLLEDPAINGVVVNARDVSERRHAEQALREREEQVRQSQKMEAVGRLAGGVAHDFNNELTVINGYSEFLLQSLDPDDPRHTYAKSVRDAGEHAADLTRQLLAFGRKQMLRPTVVNLSEIVQDSERLLRRVIGEDITLATRLDPNVDSVEADRNQIHQVVMNLSANARDAMPKGGKLTISTGNVTVQTPIVRTDADIPAGRYVLLTFADTGHGMDEATQDRIFEPFFTTKEFGKGTGLGLATVYGIVRQSGAQITVESAVGQGTVFRLYFPRVEPAPPPPEVAPPNVQAMEGTETILVVEDEASVRGLAVAALRSYGYHVVEAADGSEALRLYENRQQPIHLLLTDVVMPGMTGVELSQQLLAADPQLKVVFVSGYADSVILRHGVPDKGVSILPKPYRPAALAIKVREALGNAEPPVSATP